MFPLGERAFRVFVVGEGDEVTDSLAHGSADADPPLDVASRDWAAVDGALTEGGVDCLVLDGLAFDDGGVDAVTSVRNAAPDLPVVLLVDGDDHDVVRDALAAGATDTLPRAVATEHGAVFADRVAGVTERAFADDAIEDLYDGIAGTASVHDADTGRMVHANQTLCDLLGYDRDELLSMHIGDITPDVPGHDQERAMQLVSTVADRDSPLEVEWPLATADGAVRWVEAELSPVTIGGREFVLSASTEVTERRRREREYEAVFDGVNDVITVHDPWDEDLLDVNETLCDLTGYSRDALLSMGVDGFSATDEGFTADRAYEVQQRVAASGEAEPLDWAVETASGDRRSLDCVLSPATIAGEDRVLVLARDVTERRQLEESYRELFENVSDGLVVHDPESGEIVDANEQYCALTGYSRDELVGATVELVLPDESDYTEEALERITAARREGPQLFELTGERKDGKRFPAEIHLSVVDIRGEERVLASVRDVTERKRREREYEQIFDGVHDAIVVQDPETAQPIDANQTFLDRLGYDGVDEIRDAGFEALSATEAGYTVERARALCRRVMETGEPETVEWQQETSEGDRRWIEATVDVAEIGGEDRIISIQRDVTERRRTERRLTAILDRIDEAIFLTRAHAVTETAQEPDYVSAGYEDIYGLTLDEIQAEYDDGFFGTLHPDDEPGHRSFLESLVADIDDGDADDRYTTEYRIRRPDGEHRWVQADYYPVEWRGEPPRLVIVSRDVTDRKERERRLASFEDATEDLTTADSREEAARTAVEAATNTLDLSAVGVLLYDRDEGVLEPEAWSAALPESVSERSVGPSNGPLWESFAAGDVVRPDDTTSDSDAPVADLADWRGIPLGNHGVLFAGSTAASLDPSDVQSAHVLAATLEAALNHLRGERQVASREEELRTAAERAERFDRIARLTHQVEAAITEASAASDVERAVCQRLVDANPYEVAWIGGVEVGTDRITPSTVVGEADRYVDAMELTTADDADRHPAVEAWRADAAAVEDSIVGSGPADDWRQHVLSRGYQSVCAVPLTYNGVTHGVLCVAADTPNAFGERTREVLEQLGTSIGHALAGIERRRALESDETVELEFRGGGRRLSFARLAADAGCRVRHERTVRRGDDDVSVYFALDDDPPEDAVERARRLLSGEVTVVRDESDAVLVEVRTDTWFGSPLAEYGAVLRRATATTEETTLVVELPARSDVRSFAERVRDLAPSLELEARRQHQRANRTAEELRNRLEADLTDRQHEALRTAFAEGYFEWPRESDGSEVADRLDITQPTFNKHLRLAERKAFAALFEEET